LFLTFLRPLFFLLPPKKLKHFLKTTFWTVVCVYI
jgi:hypothetical protein